jgi:hypothetical protein
LLFFYFLVIIENGKAKVDMGKKADILEKATYKDSSIPQGDLEKFLI